MLLTRQLSIIDSGEKKIPFSEKNIAFRKMKLTTSITQA
jgi:hypothetical protein